MWVTEWASNHKYIYFLKIRSWLSFNVWSKCCIYRLIFLFFNHIMSSLKGFLQVQNFESTQNVFCCEKRSKGCCFLHFFGTQYVLWITLLHETLFTCMVLFDRRNLKRWFSWRMLFFWWLPSGWSLNTVTCFKPTHPPEIHVKGTW